ncbi:hypothetical protein [Roseivirga sp. E12]|uniref:hypothetical protein n=1 Tax=Roseivirga sp. E12 TaxID=2819237 RepID=UPI001ABC08A5|nr:hypothetical protein [Roseivirga sp. E12]MBO3700345.1 hypothetical protein [Roseivirga sp. E12]
MYVGVGVFNIFTTLATNGLGEQYLRHGLGKLGANTYVTFEGISMAYSSRFATIFLSLKERVSD